MAVAPSPNAELTARFAITRLLSIIDEVPKRSKGVTLN